jgi:N-formylglutamate amidohydrolase
MGKCGGIILNFFIGLFFTLSFVQSLNAQIIYGANNYTEFHKGTLPIVISVPHGGSIAPSIIPNRTCSSAVTVTDANTIELARQIDSAFVAATGCHPYMVYCNLARTKLDCNRNKASGACGNLSAETAWDEFHSFIDSAQASAKAQFGGKAFYLDLHGHGNPIQRIELGYLLYDTELALSDNILNTSQYVGYSSIQNLVATNVNAYSHAQLLRGNFALGTLLANRNYPAVPSLQIPAPGLSNNYFSGGFNVANHTSYLVGNSVNGVQMECNFSNVRDTYSHRKAFADSLVVVMIQYLAIHQNISVTNCNISTLNEVEPSAQFFMYPNPASNFIELGFRNLPKTFSLEIINSLGQIVLKSSQAARINSQDLPEGIYSVKVRFDGKNIGSEKIVIQK